MVRPTPSRRFRALSSRLEEWFEREQRDLPWRRGYDPWHVWVAEVMLQQTRMDVVVPYFRRFVARFPDLASLAASSEEDAVAAWSGLGYYSRARMLHRGARFLAARGGAIPSEPEHLREIPGVGRYTAGAIASIGFERRAAIVDGNVARVAARLEAMEGEKGSSVLLARQWAWGEGMVAAAASPRRLNQALMELGALVCRPRAPRCAICPVARSCAARRSGNPEAWPRPRPTAGQVTLSIPLYVVFDSERRILLERETVGTLMRGMFHLPQGGGELRGDGSARFRPLERIGSFRHSITHRRIEFQVWISEHAERVAEDPCEHVWADASTLDAIPHPSYVRKAVALATR